MPLPSGSLFLEKFGQSFRCSEAMSVRWPNNLCVIVCSRTPEAFNPASPGFPHIAWAPRRVRSRVLGQKKRGEAWCRSQTPRGLDFLSDHFTLDLSVCVGCSVNTLHFLKMSRVARLSVGVTCLVIFLYFSTSPMTRLSVSRIFLLSWIIKRNVFSRFLSLRQRDWTFI